MPVPGGSDDRLQIMLGGPADRTLCQGIVSDQNGRVAFAPWPVFDIEISAYDMLNSLKQFLHGCPMPSPEIQGMARAVIQEMLDRAGMRIGEIENVNEVAHARSVARIVVGAENLKMWPATQGSLDCNRYGVSFRRMPFTNSSFRVCSTSVEIAQDKRPKALVEVEVVQYLLYDELASTVRIDWRLGVSLIHRY